jgi:hypothetical protein
MALGDLLVFDEALVSLSVGPVLVADEVWIGIVTSTPTVSDAIPAYAAGGTTNYAAIATAGTYAAGGLLLDTIANVALEAAGVLSFKDTGASVTWAANGANAQDGEFAVVYNETTGLAYCFIDLDGPVDMQAGAVTITWNASGMFTVTRAA